MANNSRKDEVIQFRVTTAEDRMIKMAAALSGGRIKKSEYVRNSALKQAEIDLANKRNYEVSEDEMAQLLDALDSPAVKNLELSKLLSEKSVLE